MTETAKAEPSRRRPLTLEEFFALTSGCGRLMGLDVGTKTIGLALSDLSGMIASGLDTIRRTKFREDARQLLDHISRHRVAGLVVGMPFNLDGTAGPRVQATTAFMRNLAVLTDLPMLAWDERLTTAQAERMLIDADASRRRRAEVIDKVAATLILQGALDRMRRCSVSPPSGTAPG